MFCPYCGTNIADNSVICSVCGREILIQASEQPVGKEPQSSTRTDRWFLKLIAGFAGLAALILLFAAPLVNLSRTVHVYWSTIPGIYANSFFGMLLWTTSAICLLIGMILSLCLKKVPGLFVAALCQLSVSALLIVDIFRNYPLAPITIGWGYIGSVLFSIAAMILGFFSYPAYTKYKIR